MKRLSCPFCGSLEQEIYNLYYDGSHVLVFCTCGAQAGEAEDEQGAVALWNTRTSVEFQVIPIESLLCPFCGSTEQEEYQQGKDFWLWCLCGAQGSHATDREGAITAWNTRSRDRTLEKLMQKIIATTLLLPVLTFSSPGLTQVTIDFQSQPTQQQLLQVVENATKDKNYSTALRVANNAIKQFPDLATAYFYRAIALNNLGNKKDARLDFQHAKKLYLGQLKSAKISAQEKSEARVNLERIEQNLKLPKP